jgi:hypothetical protein
MRKQFFRVLWFFLFVFSLFAEEDITQDKGYINQNFRVYVKTRIPYSQDLEVEIDRDNDEDLLKAADPYLRPYNALTDNEGEIIYEDMTEIVLTFRSRKGGIYFCEGLRLFRPKFELSIPEFPVVVYNWDEQNLDFPLQLYWSPVKASVYPGEIVSLVLNVRYTESLEFPESIIMKKPAGGNLDQVDLSGSIESYEIQDKTVYAYPLESWYFSSGESGAITLPGGSVKIMGLERRIPSLSLDVRPLPEVLQKSGAVGDFTVTSRISQDRAIQGEIVSLTLRVEGTGNFHYLRFPEISSEGFELINTDEKEELVPTDTGYSGYRERTYRFQAGREQQGQIECLPYAWFNPQRETFFSYAGEIYSLEIILQGTSDKKQLNLLSPSRMEWLIVKEISHSSLRWLFLLPGIVYFLIVLFSLNEKRKAQLILLMALPLWLSMTSGNDRKERVEQGRELYVSGDISGSIDVFRELYGEKKRAAYLYDMAVLEYYQGNLVESELLIRKALLVLPGERIFLNGLSDVESLADLKDQYIVNWNISSWSLKFLLILFLNMLFFFLAQYLRNKKTSTLLIMASLFILSFILGGSSLALEWMNKRPQGVVTGEGGTLCRIPEETALEWLKLPAGTSFRLITEKRGFYFIRTGYGLEGWINSENIEKVEK